MLRAFTIKKRPLPKRALRYKNNPMRYFFIHPETITGNEAYISEPDAGHIRKVLHLKSGDMVGLLDGCGFEYRALIHSIDKQQVIVRIEEKFPCPSESPVKITLAQGFLKEKKMDELVRRLTELGVHAWVPFMAQRSVPKPAQRQMASRMQRWQTITREAIKQCHRGWEMAISEPLAFDQALDHAQGHDIKILFWENETVSLKEISKPYQGRSVSSAFVMIGPEGGLTDNEVALAIRAGFDIAGLGPRILRAETATVAAAALVQHLFGDLG